VDAYKTDPVTGLPDPDNFNNTPVTIDDGSAGFVPYAGTLDPRLDWSLGRRGIPYLDWGVHAGTAWQRDASYGGPYSPKKNIFRKSQEAAYSDHDFWNSPSAISSLNVNLIRYADVILWLAECEVEIGSLDQARSYVNEIRSRAASTQSYVYKYVDDNNPGLGFSNTPAANYKVGLYTVPFADKTTARKAVHFERRLELAMEGHRFFDLVRWGEVQTTLTKYISFEKTLRNYLNDASFTTGQDEYQPIPQRQIDLSQGKLKQNPGY
jgi:starch-binding outer membrane protein, SusD/RagB family